MIEIILSFFAVGEMFGKSLRRQAALVQLAKVSTCMTSVLLSEHVLLYSSVNYLIVCMQDTWHCV